MRALRIISERTRMCRSVPTGALTEMLCDVFEGDTTTLERVEQHLQLKLGE